MSDDTAAPTPAETPAAAEIPDSPAAPAGQIVPGMTPEVLPEAALPETSELAAEEVAAEEALIAPVVKSEKPATPEQRARRGANVAGAISLPLATAGIVMLAVPLAVWYLNTIIRTVAVVIANAVSGKGAAEETNETLASIEPGAVGSVTLAFAIIGAAFLIAGVLVSFFVMRSHGVARAGMVTAVAFPVGFVIATILSASLGALGGLIFGTSDTVSQILANAAFGIALTTIGSVAVTVATGALVWPVVARVFRPERDAHAAR
ncbi:hypothetical protein [Salinibacterium sp. ZJ70]|uniref:hypothetical protein n=1 Tax=Salinibacterium sp. ZJ70 TaxID=2708084 RepID=UPI00142119A1|nr:hypothetical protein [Salinibacterium sp. ZJ70]